MARKNNKKSFTDIPKEIKDNIHHKNLNLVDKVNTWQEYPNVKDLLCTKCGTKYEGKIKGLKVYLCCPNCGHYTSKIPKVVLQANFNSKLTVLLKNKKNNLRFIEKLKDY